MGEGLQARLEKQLAETYLLENGLIGASPLAGLEI
jgi:hypothetical protein